MPYWPHPFCHPASTGFYRNASMQSNGWFDCLERLRARRNRPNQFCESESLTSLPDLDKTALPASIFVARYSESPALGKPFWRAVVTWKGHSGGCGVTVSLV